MGGLVKMLGGVLVLRGIAAAHVTALEAKPQVDPGIAHFQTFFATFSTGSDFAYLLDVLAGCSRTSHDDSFLKM
jgi:hypothetical protein